MVPPIMNYLRLLGPHVGRIQGRRRPGRPRRASSGRGRRHERTPARWRRDARAPARRRRHARAEATRAHGRRPVDRARARSTRGRGRTSSRAPPRRPRPRAPRRRPRRQPPPAARRHGSRGPTSVEHLACGRGRGCTSMFRRRRLAISMPACLVMIMSRSRRMSAPSRRGSDQRMECSPRRT